MKSIVIVCAIGARAAASPACADAGAGAAIDGVWPSDRSVTVCVSDRCLRWELASGAWGAVPRPDEEPRDPDVELADTGARAITLCSEEGDACRTLAPPGYHANKERIHAWLDPERTRVAIRDGATIAIYAIGDRLKKVASVRGASTAAWVGAALLVRGHDRAWLADARRGRTIRAIAGAPVHTANDVEVLSTDGVHVIRAADGKALWTIDADHDYGAHAAPPRLFPLGGDTLIVVYELGFVVIDARSGAHEAVRVPSC
ncbi:MAG TPA: hypothetical protein VL463_01345 [Kofleriaceae bacterium]|nr:hypothetical protein [Kofleriaceae bacterium]